MGSSLFGEERIAESFSPDETVVLHPGDALGFLRNLPDGFVSLVVTSPPYNLGKEYERKTALHSYLVEQGIVADELMRVLKSNGSLCWQVGNFVEQGEVFPLDVFFYSMFSQRGMKLRNRIIWHFGHGLHASRRFSGRYETVLWFTKADDYIFNLDSVRVPSKYPEKTHFKGPKRGAGPGNPAGETPSEYN